MACNQCALSETPKKEEKNHNIIIDIFKYKCHPYRMAGDIDADDFPKRIPKIILHIYWKIEIETHVILFHKLIRPRSCAVKQKLFETMVSPLEWDTDETMSAVVDGRSIQFVRSVCVMRRRRRGAATAAGLEKLTYRFGKPLLATTFVPVRY